MAPDLNSLNPFSSAQAGHHDHYEVPDIVIEDPANRKIKVLTIGAGVSGILMAYQIQKQLQNIEHVIYEKNPDIGGTWLENKYPGCACDIPSHAYTYNFALNVRIPLLLLCWCLG
jgi:hydroxyversicolorone monooxygenase